MKVFEILEGDVVDFAAKRRSRLPDDPSEPLRRAARDLKASRATVSNFDAAKQRKMNKQAGPKPPLPNSLNPDYEPPKASVSKLPLRSRDDVATQIEKVLRELDTKFTWVDDHTAVAHYNPADYIRAVQAFDKLFGDRTRAGPTSYSWRVDDVTISFALETRKLIIEIE